jgi:hypothetical protein
MPEQEIKPTVKMRLKVGASVFQDFGFYRWPELRRGAAPVDTLFNVEFMDDGKRARLSAPGYGDDSSPNAYGSGAIHVFVSNLQFVKEDVKEAA